MNAAVRPCTALAFLVAATLSCAPHPGTGHETIAERRALVAQQPLDFVIPSEEAAEAWSRAQRWIAEHGARWDTGSLETVTDSVIQTGHGLTVTRRPHERGGEHFRVRWNGASSGGFYLRAMQELARTIQHGA